MLRPSIVGRILQALDVQPGDAVLEIGTGTGYFTHCLSRHAGSVTSIDIHDDFIRAAQARLADAGVTNVTLHCMDATVALPEGQFDAIAVTGAIDAIDNRYIAALKPGGRLFVVTGSSPVMTAHLVTVGEDGKTEDKELFETDIPPLVSGPRRPVFSF
jgi:protein-L-isoaspartate(D-aspartate) O-methyltransferase